ncbi:MAG: hypothetical protein V3R78_10305, partial [Thermodesulfobacteriota bacterium]
LMLANHAPRKWEWNKQVFECKAGQFVTSLDSLQKACAKGVSVKMIRTALKKLEKWEFLADKGAKTGRLITITNWDSYQNVEVEKGKPKGRKGAKKGQSKGKEGAANKNEKNNKELKEDLYIRLSEKFWSLYPKRKGKKVGKPDCLEYINKKIEEPDFQSLLRATKNYSESSEVKDGFVRNPIRFLEKDFWREWIEGETVEPEEMTQSELDRIDRDKREAEARKRKDEYMARRNA